LKRSPYLSNEWLVVAPPATAASGGDCDMQSSPKMNSVTRNSHNKRQFSSDFFELKRPSPNVPNNNNSTTAHHSSWFHSSSSFSFASTTSDSSSPKNSSGGGRGGVHVQHYHSGGGEIRPHHGPYTRRRAAPSVHSLQFFPGVLDPLDGHEYDLNRESRNIVWKEIQAQKDALIEDICSTSDSGSGNNRSARPCVSDDNQNASDDNLLDDNGLDHFLGGTMTASSYSKPLSWGKVNKSRRSLTVGAGLAYDRIPDWHIRSRLSRG